MERGLDWDSLSPSARKGLNIEACSERKHNSLLQKRTEATEACARKMAQSEDQEEKTSVKCD